MVEVKAFEFEINNAVSIKTFKYIFEVDHFIYLSLFFENFDFFCESKKYRWKHPTKSKRKLYNLELRLKINVYWCIDMFQFEMLLTSYSCGITVEFWCSLVSIEESPHSKFELIWSYLSFLFFSILLVVQWDSQVHPIVVFLIYMQTHVYGRVDFWFLFRGK
jgi:hypothetical protein